MQMSDTYKYAVHAFSSVGANIYIIATASVLEVFFRINKRLFIELSVSLYSNIGPILNTYLAIFRSSSPWVFLEKGVLKICSKFTGEHTCWNLISINLLCNLIEITLRQGYSPVNLLYIFRTPFSRNTYGGLLLNINTFV